MPLLHNLLLLGFLVLLEGILSLDNTLILAMTVRTLPRDQRKRALTYGLWGAALFRLGAILLASRLIQAHGLKLLGGVYLLFIAFKHLFWGKRPPSPKNSPAPEANPRSFWRTVLLIEVLDFMYAADSILAAIAVTQNLWLIFLGGMLGVVLIRFAASAFVGLLERFPGFERIAYILVLEVGLKLGLDGASRGALSFESPTGVPFWIFWSTVIVTIAAGFLLKPKARAA